MEFTILKASECNINPLKKSIVKEVVWNPPILNWIKCNCDSDAIGSPCICSCGVIFKNHNAQFWGCFVEGLGIENSLTTKLSGVIDAWKLKKNALIFGWKLTQC